MTETSEMIRTTTILVHPTRRSPQPYSQALADPRRGAGDSVALDSAGQDSMARPALMGRHASARRALMRLAVQTMRHVLTCALSSVAVEAEAVDSVGAAAAACLSLDTTVLVSVEDAVADLMEVSVAAVEAMKGSVGVTTTRSRAEVMTVEASVGDRTDSVEDAVAEAVDLDQV